MSRRPPHRWRAALVNLAAVVALLGAASLLPPDTSLADRQASGVLKLCVPPRSPPLVTGDTAAPGFDVELGQAIADRLGLRLALNTLPSIGQDFNPRNWFLSRAQCDMVGGGVADTVQTRSFLQTVPTAARTGWIGVSPTGSMPPAGGRVAVLPGTSGLNRVALSTWLRSQQLRPVLVRSPAELAQALTSGTADAAITERFALEGLDLDTDRFQIFWLQGDGFASYPMALGLWKGDQTLLRAVRGAVDGLDQSGALDALRDRYNVAADLAERAF